MRRRSVSWGWKMPPRLEQPYFDRLIELRIPGEYTGVDQSGQPVYEDDVDRRVWATRSDSTPQNDLIRSGDINAAVRHRSYRIRLENAAGLVEGMVVVDEDGLSLELRGVSQTERRYVDLLVREVD